MLVFRAGSPNPKAVPLSLVTRLEEIDARTIELVSEKPGFLGSAVIKGQATEVIDIAHFLPLAFADWRSWKEQTADKAVRRVLLIDDAPFFRNMLAPVVKAAG